MKKRTRSYNADVRAAERMVLRCAEMLHERPLRWPERLIFDLDDAVAALRAAKRRAGRRAR